MTSTPATVEEQRRPRPATVPATATTPEIKFFDSDLEVSYQFDRADGEQVNFALTHGGLVASDLTLAVLECEDLDARQQIDLTYAEARLLRAYLNRPEVVRRLDAVE